jgi:hypothetical protein
LFAHDISRSLALLVSGAYPICSKPQHCIQHSQFCEARVHPGFARSLRRVTPLATALAYHAPVNDNEAASREPEEPVHRPRRKL